MKIDGGKHTIFDSVAILRYVGKLTKLYPQDEIEAAKVDEILGSAEDHFGQLGFATVS